MNKIVDWEYTKSLYNKKSAWPENNIWHEYTYSQIKQYIENKFVLYTNKNSKILNVGSGGTVYDIKGIFYHLDIADELIKDLDNAFIGSAENMPFDDKTFDNAICVGSVLNYCNAMSVINEMHRVLKPNGYIVLEFERSGSGEFLFTKNYNISVFPNWYEYNNQKHMLWMYSENYIFNLLKIHNFEVLNCHRFHTLSALANRFINLTNNNLPSIINKDKYFLWMSKLIAHNAILLAKKLD